MVFREYSENLASEFRARAVAPRTTSDFAKFRAWAILDRCAEAFPAVIHVGREKVRWRTYGLFELN